MTAAAEQQQTAAATARPVAARWKHRIRFQSGKAAAADGSAAAADMKRVKKMGSLLPMLLRSSTDVARASSSSARQGKRDKYSHEIK